MSNINICHRERTVKSSCIMGIIIRSSENIEANKDVSESPLEEILMQGSRCVSVYHRHMFCDPHDHFKGLKLSIARASVSKIGQSDHLYGISFYTKPTMLASLSYSENTDWIMSKGVPLTVSVVWYSNKESQGLGPNGTHHDKDNRPKRTASRL